MENFTFLSGSLTFEQNSRKIKESVNGKPYYANKLHWIRMFTTLQRYVQENAFRSFEEYCITLGAHFVKKKNTLKSNIKLVSFSGSE